MRAINDSVLVNRIQMEEHSKFVQLDCVFYEGSQVTENQIFLDYSAFNRLLIEMEVRGNSLDLDAFEEVHYTDNETIYLQDLTQSEPLFLPIYCLPTERILLRA